MSELRPMTAADLVIAERISDAAYGAVEPSFGNRTPTGRARWMERTGHLLDTDPGGCWVTVVDGEVVGFAASFRREDTWFLASYAVRLDLQGQGLGRELMDAASAYGAGCSAAMLSASADPKAEARYRAAGFTLVPQWRFTGTVQLEAEPLPPAELDLDELDRSIRGSGHGPDHAILAAQFRLVTTTDGYAYLDADGSPVLLCARNEAAAATLLRHVLAAAPGEVTVSHVSAANPWAHRIAEAAGLVAVRSGSLAVRGMEAPSPYLHHGALL